MIPNLIRQILRDMWAHKLRSVLALFGIIWGTLTVILLLSLGEGFHQASLANMMKIADGTLFGHPGRTSISYRGFPAGQLVNIKASAIVKLKKVVPNIFAISPMLKTTSEIGHKGEQSTYDVFGVASDFAILRKTNLQSNSRFIKHLDVKNKAFVTVIGNKLKERFFGDRPALGKKITINHADFTIIGILQSKEKNVYNWFDNRAMIPYTTYTSLFGNQNVHRFIILPNPDVDSQRVAESIRSYLGYRYHFNPDDEQAVRIIDTTKFFQFFKWFFVGIQLFLGFCGALTLAVGSLGVTNIMFLIVTERTREIGLRLSVGARDWHIMLQIILEALTIVGLGGLIGFMLAWMTTSVLSHVPLPAWLGKPTISPAVVLITIVILMILGLLSSYFPAKRASKMDPVEALNF